MVNFPFYRYPYYYRVNELSNLSKTNSNLKPQTPLKYNNYPDNFENTSKQENEKIDNVQVSKKQSSRYNSYGPFNFQNLFSLDFKEPVFEILGIKLYLDDLLIINLLFFLYKEGVKDDLLFLSLILLLIS